MPPLSATVAAPSPPAGASEPVPTLRLPGDTRPTAEAIELHVDPKDERFSGAVDIDVRLDRPRGVLWLHGKDLHVAAATVTPEGGAPIAATWAERSESGFASLTLAALAPAGKARIHVAFDAPFSRGQSGLYRAREAGESYAFTQFESVAARTAFPCFDEPGFKIPFTTTLIVPSDMQAIANTREVARTGAAGSLRVSFAPTEPLPSYLVAFAVGALDVVAAADVRPNAVRARALPLRGVTARGRGKEIAYALAHTGEILSVLEAYTGIAYPYDKLDILAVPGKRGAMENAGAVTFGEQLLLLDATNAAATQRRAYASVMAHELAHQWTGDLVTMAWWDDTWLNEAFATWLGAKTVDAWDPKMNANVYSLHAVQGAMSTDSLVSARAIRQPIESTHDIENAFDGITYQKGAGVLAMFERWAGAEAWQRGLHAYLEAHRFGSGTADEFLDAENAATGKDVKTAMHTFLDQPGVPIIDASVVCAAGARPRVHLAQSRFLPLGSTGGATAGGWQIPVCVRADRDVACTLLTAPEADLELPGAKCPSSVFPNADGSGYYRFALAPADLASLRSKGLGGLSEREKIAYATSLRAAYERGTTPFKETLAAAAPLARDLAPEVAEEPMRYLSEARDWLFGDAAQPEVERSARATYAPVASRLGWEAKKGEPDEAQLLRRSVLAFLVQTGRDEKVRAEAKRRGLAYVGAGKDGKDSAVHPEAVEASVAGVALSVVGEDADRATWDGLKALLGKTVDETVRGRLMSALSSARNPDLALAARELVLDPGLRDNEVLIPLFVQASQPETREAAWAWAKEHFDPIVARLPKRGGTALVGLARSFCDEGHAADVESFFRPKIERLEGGPRVLASTLEQVRLCAARRKAQAPSAREAFSAKR